MADTLTALRDLMAAEFGVTDTPTHAPGQTARSFDIACRAPVTRREQIQGRPEEVRAALIQQAEAFSIPLDEHEVVRVSLSSYVDQRLLDPADVQPPSGVPSPRRFEQWLADAVAHQIPEGYVPVGRWGASRLDAVRAADAAWREAAVARVEAVKAALVQHPQARVAEALGMSKQAFGQWVKRGL